MIQSITQIPVLTSELVKPPPPVVGLANTAA
jgi:hypothetical protein